MCVNQQKSALTPLTFSTLMLFRGIFNQGYLCTKCGNGAHKGCLGRLGACGRAGNGQ